VKVAKPLLTSGVEQRAIKLERAANGLLYPTDPALTDVGAPRDLVPVKREEVGASWYRSPAPEAAFGTGRTLSLQPDASLAEAVGNAQAGDILSLAPGAYDVAAPLVLRHWLTIAGKKGAAPVLRLTGGGLARIDGGGGLRLENVEIDARTLTADAALIAVGAGAAPNYGIALNGIAVRGPGKAARLDGIVIAPGTFADAIEIEGSRFSDMGVVVAGAGEQDAKGWYPVERLTIAGSRFDRVAMVADLLRKGTDESTFGPWFAMSGSNVADSGENGASLRLSGVQHAAISGNDFTRSAPVVVIHSVGTPDTRIAGNRFVATLAPRIEELAYKGPQRAVLAGNAVEARP